MINGIVFFDYDGTLVDERVGMFLPTQLTKDTIKLLQEKNYLCVLATGRALSYVPQGALDLKLDGFICANGAFIAVNGNIIHREVFSANELLTLIEQMNDEHVNYILESYQHCYVKDMQEEHFQDFVNCFGISMQNFVSLPNFTDIANEVEKITIIPPNENVMDEWVNRLKDRYDCCCHRNVTSFDITPLHLHKGCGVQKFIEHFQIPFEHTYAFGDGTNDIGLLKNVKYGIAMHQHAKELDAHAYMITKSVKEEGIYHALKELEVIA